MDARPYLAIGGGWEEGGGDAGLITHNNKNKIAKR